MNSKKTLQPSRNGSTELYAVRLSVSRESRADCSWEAAEAGAADEVSCRADTAVSLMCVVDMQLTSANDVK